METHRVLHDFAELTYDDIGASSPKKFRTSLRSKRYPFLIGVLALGALLGYFLKRK